MTLQEVKDKYPDIYNEIGKEAARRERERLKAIDEIAMNLPKKMVDEAKYDNCISAEKLAFDALKANESVAVKNFNDIIYDNLESGVKEVDSQDSLSEAVNGKEERIKRLADFINKGGVK